MKAILSLSAPSAEKADALRARLAAFLGCDPEDVLALPAGVSLTLVPRRLPSALRLIEPAATEPESAPEEGD